VHQGGKEARRLGPVTGAKRHEARIAEVDTRHAIAPLGA
jgi:hypothetical protein